MEVLIKNMIKDMYSYYIRIFQILIVGLAINLFINLLFITNFLVILGFIIIINLIIDLRDKK